MATLNLLMPQGQTFDVVMTWKISGTPVDLSTYTAKLQMRQRVSATDADLTLTDGSGITLGSDGTIAILVSASDTATINTGTYVYDLELTSSDTVRRLVEGTITVSAEVTRD